MRGIGVVVGFGLLALGVAYPLGLPSGEPAGAQVQPPRDPTTQAASVPGIIRGRVTAADTGQPLRFARVTVYPRPRDSESATVTDAEGRYELPLPPGRYTLRVSKAGYVALDFGQRRTRERGTFIELAANQILTGVNVTLPRGGVLTGALFDPFGDPAPNATVRALRYEFASGRWELSMVGRDTLTDDRGAFRIFGLPPGEYYLEAAFGVSRWRAQREERAYAPTFYPGTSDTQTAQRLRVDLGQEIAGLDFRLQTVLTARVAGRVVDANGRPSAGVPAVSLIREGVTTTRASLWSSRVAADGSFVISGVPPGTYTAYANESGVTGGGRFATSPVTVSGDDAEGLQLTLGSGASARGRIVFEPRVTPDFEPDSLLPFTMPRGSDLVPVGRGLGHVNDDWTFEIRGMAGAQLVRISGMADNWTIRAVALAGRDITDVPIVFPTHMPTTGLQILLTDRTTRLTGTVVDTSGQPTIDYTAIVFPVDRDRWTFPSRFVRAARPDQRGVFTVEGLPPAPYLGFAAPSVPEGAWTDPRFLERITPLAERFSLGDGERRGVQLRVGTVP